MSSNVKMQKVPEGMLALTQIDGTYYQLVRPLGFTAEIAENGETMIKYWLPNGDWVCTVVDHLHMVWTPEGSCSLESWERELKLYNVMRGTGL